MTLLSRLVSVMARFLQISTHPVNGSVENLTPRYCGPPPALSRQGKRITTRIHTPRYWINTPDHTPLKSLSSIDNVSTVLRTPRTVLFSSRAALLRSIQGTGTA